MFYRHGQWDNVRRHLLAAAASYCRQLTWSASCPGSPPRARDEKGPAKLQARFCVPVQFVIRNSTVFNQVNLSPPFASLQFTIAI